MSLVGSRLHGPLELVTAATVALVSSAEAIAHSRIPDTTEATLIDAWIAAATRHVQRISGRQLLTATYDLPVSDWWEWDCLKLPKPPLQSVTSVKYYDTTNTLTTLASSNYFVRTPADAPGYIEFDTDFSSPSTYERMFPITVRFVCGWSTAALVPPTFKQAVYMLAAHYHEHREASIVGSISKELEFAVTALVGAEAWGSYS